MPPKKRSKAKNPRIHPYQNSFDVEYGLRVTDRDPETSVVTAAVCRFCECWGREDCEVEAGENGRKRKRTTNTKYFRTSFRTDNIRKHLEEQHPQKHAAYVSLRKKIGSTPEKIKRFFEQSTVEAFVEKRSTVVSTMRVFTIDKNIVEVIVSEFLMPQCEAEEDEGNDEPDVDGIDTPKVLPRGDRGMDMFEPQYETAVDGSKSVSCYKVTVADPLQFDSVVSLLAAGLSFRQISRVVRENRDRFGSASKAGCLSDGEASCLSRIVCAVGLQIIADLMERSWAFAVVSDISTDNFGSSHLDTRIHFPFLDAGDDLFSAHLLAIPLSEELHSESLFNLFSKVFSALCPSWKDKLIGSSTDGAPNMTACNVGFTTQCANAATTDVFYRIWCLAHQLDLINGTALHAIADIAGFPFLHTLTTIAGWLRRQETLIRRMGSKCPYCIDVQWTSVSKVRLTFECVRFDLVPRPDLSLL